MRERRSLPDQVEELLTAPPLILVAVVSVTRTSREFHALAAGAPTVVCGWRRPTPTRAKKFLKLLLCLTVYRWHSLGPAGARCVSLDTTPAATRASLLRGQASFGYRLHGRRRVHRPPGQPRALAEVHQRLRLPSPPTTVTSWTSSASAEGAHHQAKALRQSGAFQHDDDP
jgi:hypothetical protein